MNRLTKLVLFLIIGVALGLVSSQQMTSGRAGNFAKSDGEWVVWPGAGRTDVDPYTRAHFLLDGRIPPSQFEVMEYEAQTDSDKNELKGNCAFILSGTLPAVRWWSLSVLQPSAETPETSVLTAQDAIYEPAGGINVSISPEPQPGNWLPVSGDGRYSLLLRLYSPSDTIRNRPQSAPLPKLSRGDCP